MLTLSTLGHFNCRPIYEVLGIHVCKYTLLLYLASQCCTSCCLSLYSQETRLFLNELNLASIEKKMAFYKVQHCSIINAFCHMFVILSLFPNCLCKSCSAPYRYVCGGYCCKMHMQMDGSHACHPAKCQACTCSNGMTLVIAILQSFWNRKRESTDGSVM